MFHLVAHSSEEIAVLNKEMLSRSVPLNWPLLLSTYCICGRVLVDFPSRSNMSYVPTTPTTFSLATQPHGDLAVISYLKRYACPSLAALVKSVNLHLLIASFLSEHWSLY